MRAIASARDTIEDAINLLVAFKAMDNVANELGMTLHDRATRGESLTVEEVQQLEAWYVQQDEAEAAWLTPPTVAAPNLIGLQAQVDHMLEQLTAVTRQMQQVVSENHQIRQEIAELQQQLVVRRSA